MRLASLKSTFGKEDHMTEFAIWGVPPHQTEEALLIDKPHGKVITDRDYAERLVRELEEKHGCTKVRIQ